MNDRCVVRDPVTGRYPRGAFGYVEGVIRWHNRVVGYALIPVTDRYPPFRLALNRTVGAAHLGRSSDHRRRRGAAGRQP